MSVSAFPDELGLSDLETPKQLLRGSTDSIVRDSRAAEYKARLRDGTVFWNKAFSIQRHANP